MELRMSNFVSISFWRTPVFFAGVVQVHHYLALHGADFFFRLADLLLDFRLNTEHVPFKKVSHLLYLEADYIFHLLHNVPRCPFE
ncbi:MAG: hypothetical protein LIQ31_04155 [Planctomycetes bacterium]|nr:hypothetical protein [Planctomycetota bacterium]